VGVTTDASQRPTGARWPHLTGCSQTAGPGAPPSLNRLSAGRARALRWL